MVIDAAQVLADAGVRRAADFAGRQAAAQAAYLSVKGCGPVTWAYLRMLLGVDDVKADTWVVRFVTAGLGRSVTSSEAQDLVTDVARSMGVPSRDLDHAIWRFQRSA